MNKGQNLYKKAKSIIPGGTQLLSKRPEMFLPDYWPSYYDKAKGCEVIDLDGNKFYDLSYMGIGSCILGYADDDVNLAVEDAIKKGSMSTLNSYEEVDLAELLIEIHPWAEMVRYARSGGEAMSIAVRIARAYSKKDKVLFCGYHGWHDWYLSANLADNKSLDGHLIQGLNPIGVPRNLKGLTLPFNYNDTESFIALIEKYNENIGAIVLETIRNYEPEKEFLETIRKYSTKYGIPLVVDEISSGFRLNVGGAHLIYNLEPDIAVFSKGLSNGFPMAAIIGK
ncbi:MAG: aminotransferase class III-fold pyridoxal phosphate-dependent enzyme, partial [Ignavibacteria bacterium]